MCKDLNSHKVKLKPRELNFPHIHRESQWIRSTTLVELQRHLNAARSGFCVLVSERSNLPRSDARTHTSSSLKPRPQQAVGGATVMTLKDETLLHVYMLDVS